MRYVCIVGGKRICIFKEEYVKKVQVSNCLKYERSDILGELFPMIKNGLFMANGKEHAWQRKLLNPVFSQSSVLEFVKTFDSAIENLIKVG